MPGILSGAFALVTALLAAPPVESADDASAAISGVVLDAEGRPVAGACLAVLRSTEGTFDVFDTPFPDCRLRSDARGRFVLRTAPGRVAVVASRTDAAVTLRVTPVSGSGEGVQVVVRFDGVASIRGRALDEAGRPLAKVRVTAIPERTGAAASRGDAIIVRAWSGEDGSFLLAGLAPGDHRLLARAPGYHCVEACEHGRGMRVRTGPSPVSLPLEPAGSVSGRVLGRAGPGGPQPVPYFEVYSPATGTVPVRSPDGRFRIHVPRPVVGAPLFVRAPELAPFATTFELPKPTALDLGDILLGPGRAVSGRVRDSSGRPVEGALVRVGFSRSALDDPAALTDAAGAFRIAGVSEGTTRLTVSHPRFRPQDLVAAAGEVDVRLSAGIALSVSVEDTDGEPLAGAWVWSVLSRAECQTGPDGRCYLTGVEQREEVLEAQLRGTARPRARQLRVPIASPAPAPVTLRLPRRPSLLKVIVVGPDGAFARAWVQVVPGDAAPERALGPKGRLQVPYYASGIDLEKRFENLPPQRYTVLAESFEDPARCTARVVELAEGADQSLTLKLPADRGPCRP